MNMINKVMINIQVWYLSEDLQEQGEINATFVNGEA